MLIPSIDLMGGKIVQLVQGRQKALEFDNFQEWIDRFSKYPLVQLIDLDAAMGRVHNADILREIARQLPCQVGGGIRSLEAAQAALALGAQRVIIGSSLISKGAINTAGLLQGIPLDVVRQLRSSTSKQFIAAGGIRTQEEVSELHAIGVDAVVGMAIYRGLMP